MKKLTKTEIINSVTDKMTREGFRFSVSTDVTSSRAYAYYVVTVFATNETVKLSTTFEGSTLNFDKTAGHVYAPKLQTRLESNLNTQLRDWSFKANSNLGKAIWQLINKYQRLASSPAESPEDC